MTPMIGPVGVRREGFILREVAELSELRGLGSLWEHERSGAWLLHLDTGDEERLFSAAFRTPPPDDTGLPHILEHTVLCGSRRYPVKDPFVEMLKTSLATFLNAITWPDRTQYPCASMNERDFRNLMAVYCDAVFQPLLREDHFRQEGHHLAPADPENPAGALSIRGIVFSEMKGAYATLEGVLDRVATAELFPDTPTGRDAGGLPEAIPNLTYEQFLEFHRRYYHPSNAYLFLFTPGDPAAHLAFLDREVLASFQRQTPPPPMPLQPRWSSPRRVTALYPALPADTPDRKAAHVMEWLLNPSEDVDTTIALGVATEYLLAHPGSPLRRALLESCLGEEVLEYHSTARREGTLVVGLSGIDRLRVNEVEEVVFSTLRAEVERGFEGDQVDAAFHQFELTSRHVPDLHPLRLMDRVYGAWLYGASPWTWLRIGERLDSVRRRMAAERRFLEDLVRHWILDNSHRLHITLIPDPHLTRRQEERWARRLDRVRSSMSASDLERVASEARELERRQAEPNPPEALATLPRLSRSDVSLDPAQLNVSRIGLGGQTCLRVDAPTCGVLYLRLAIDLSHVDERWWPWLPSLAAVWTQGGAAGLDYAAMARREAACCSGLSAIVQVGGRVDDRLAFRPTLQFAVHALDGRVPAMLEVLRDRLWSADYSDRGRLVTILAERQAGLREDVVPSGSAYASLRAARRWTPNARQAEILGGIEQVRFAVVLAERARRNPGEVISALNELRNVVLSSPQWLLAVAGSDEPTARAMEAFGGWLARRPPATASLSAPLLALADRPGPPEGLAISSEVAFGAVAFPGPALDDPMAAPLRVLLYRLALDHLWTEIRVKRGAYGARAQHGTHSGVVTMSSYRDPAVGESLAVFRRVADHVELEMALPPEEMEQAVIGALKGLDQPVRPASAVATAVERELSGATDDFRRRFRRRLLDTTMDDLRRVAAEVLRPGLETASVCVLAGRDTLDTLGIEGLRIEDLLPSDGEGDG